MQTFGGAGSLKKTQQKEGGGPALLQQITGMSIRRNPKIADPHVRGGERWWVYLVPYCLKIRWVRKSMGPHPPGGGSVEAKRGIGFGRK